MNSCDYQNLLRIPEMSQRSAENPGRCWKCIKTAQEAELITKEKSSWWKFVWPDKTRTALTSVPRAKQYVCRWKAVTSNPQNINYCQRWSAVLCGWELMLDVLCTPSWWSTSLSAVLSGCFCFCLFIDHILPFPPYEIHANPPAVRAHALFHKPSFVAVRCSDMVWLCSFLRCVLQPAPPPHPPHPTGCD